MDPLTFIVLIAFSLVLAIGLLIYAPGFLVLYGPLIATCWSAAMLLYVGCAYLWAWLEDVRAARERAGLDRKLDAWIEDAPDSWRENLGKGGSRR